MATTTKKTGFFDLPLELRQQIYEKVLPNDRVITSSKTWPSMQQMSRLVKVDPRIGRELRQYAYKQCRTWRFVMSSREPLPSQKLQLNKARRIEIFISELRNPILFDRREQIKALRRKINDFVKMLERYERLPPISIRFVGTWSDRENWSGKIGGDCDLMVDEDTPVIEFILDPFERLRNCDGAFIEHDFEADEDADWDLTATGLKSTDDEYERVTLYIERLEDQMERPG